MTEIKSHAWVVEWLGPICGCASTTPASFLWGAFYLYAIVLFVCVVALHPSQQFIGHVGMIFCCPGLKYLSRCKVQRNSDFQRIHIFSDSQSAVGQLTLGWEAKSHKNTTKEVKSEISKLHDCNVEVELSWSPGHANIKGNEYADQLAKEAAQEAKDAEDLWAVTSFGDVKLAAKESGIMKWQERWEASERGRNLYTFRPKVGHKIQHSFVSPVGESIVSQLRTGYVGLNEYLHKCKIKETDLCKCGAKETLSHFLLECQEFDTTREFMRKRIFETCGITHLDLSLLLDAKEDDEFKDWRSFMLSELENFVVGTRRFATRQ